MTVSDARPSISELPSAQYHAVDKARGAAITAALDEIGPDENGTDFSGFTWLTAIAPATTSTAAINTGQRRIRVLEVDRF